tara:strand:- start:16499 stop:17665 length:1167 start_codon:yes stop_codon:yes gene_type:complete
LKLGVHYHIPVLRSKGSLYTHGNFGIFINFLAKEVSELFLVAHSPKENQLNDCNYKIESQNVTLIDLGEHCSVASRYLNFFSHYKKIKYAEKKVNFFILRAPTPLLPIFLFVNIRKTLIYAIGDYLEVIKSIKIKNFKYPILLIYAYFITFCTKILSYRGLVMTNSIELKNKLKTKYNSVKIVYSSTIRNNELINSSSKNFHNPIRLLYTGRFDDAKGIDDIIQAIYILKKKEININLHLAGYFGNGKYLKHLKKISKKLYVSDKIIYHGLLKLGDELNTLYRNSDILIIASKSEGFPRSIWEAFSNSVPVITTNVGSIPYILKNKHDSIIINHSSPIEIVDAVIELKTNKRLRKKILINSIKLAKTATIENNSKKMVELIENININQ